MSSPHVSTPNTTPPPMDTESVSGTTNTTNTTEIENNTVTTADDAMDVDVDIDTLSLPLSKIKRIFKMDPEYTGASQSAVYATGVATELFIQYLTEQALAIAKLDKRKKIVYKDVSTAVNSQDTLYFLSDTVPKTIPLQQILKETPKEPDHDIQNMLPVATEEPEPVKKSAVTDLVG